MSDDYSFVVAFVVYLFNMDIYLYISMYIQAEYRRFGVFIFYYVISCTCYICSDRILTCRIKSIRSPAKVGLVVTDLITSPVVSWEGWETPPPPPSTAALLSFFAQPPAW